MNIYWYELKTKFKSMLIWSLSISALILLFMSLFKGFSADSALLNSMLEKFPRQLLIAFGMQDTNFSNVLGYYAMLFVFCQICLAIQASNYGFGLVSIEEAEWTADFLLSKPVRRWKILTSKLLAAVSAIVITELIVSGFSFLFLKTLGAGQEVATKPLVLLMTSMLVFQLFFLAVGMAISQVVKRVPNVIPFSMALVFGLYILNAFGGMLGEKSLEVISPFQHFAPGYIVKNATWDMSLAWISIAFIIIAIPLSYFLYSRRNITSAV